MPGDDDAVLVEDGDSVGWLMDGTGRIRKSGIGSGESCDLRIAKLGTNRVMGKIERALSEQRFRPHPSPQVDEVFPERLRLRNHGEGAAIGSRGRN